MPSTFSKEVKKELIEEEALQHDKEKLVNDNCRKKRKVSNEKK